MKLAKEYMLTTVDNPYDPFTNFDEWYEFDRLKGYDTCGYLARIAKTSSKLSDELNQLAVNDAIDEICRYNWRGIYRKVEKGDIVNR